MAPPLRRAAPLRAARRSAARRFVEDEFTPFRARNNDDADGRFTAITRRDSGLAAARGKFTTRLLKRPSGHQSWSSRPLRPAGRRAASPAASRAASSSPRQPAPDREAAASSGRSSAVRGRRPGRRLLPASQGSGARRLPDGTGGADRLWTGRKGQLTWPDRRILLPSACDLAAREVLEAVDKPGSGRPHRPRRRR